MCFFVHFPPELHTALVHAVPGRAHAEIICWGREGGERSRGAGVFLVWVCVSLVFQGEQVYVCLCVSVCVILYVGLCTERAGGSVNGHILRLGVCLRERQRGREGANMTEQEYSLFILVKCEVNWSKQQIFFSLFSGISYCFVYCKSWKHTKNSYIEASFHLSSKRLLHLWT